MGAELHASTIHLHDGAMVEVVIERIDVVADPVIAG
jgi:hypothetical protein